MDINNYSYAPSMLDEDTTSAYFENDDMYIEIDKDTNIFWLYATSYDGDLEISGKFTEETTVQSVFNYIKSHYATTPPEDNQALQNVIDKYANSLMRIVYPFDFFVKL